MSGWNREPLAKAYYALGQERTRVAQPADSPIDDALRQAMDLIEEADELLKGIAA